MAEADREDIQAGGMGSRRPGRPYRAGWLLPDRLRPGAVALLCLCLHACSDEPSTGDRPDQEIAPDLPDEQPLDAETGADAEPDRLLVDREEEEGTARYPHCSGAGDAPEWTDWDRESATLVLHCPEVDLTLQALQDGVVRMVYGAVGTAAPSRSWAVTGPLHALDEEMFVGQTGWGVELCLAGLAIEGESTGCRLRVTQADGLVLLEDPADGGWSAGTALLEGQSVPTTAVTRITPATERFYGLGEHAGPLERRGSRQTFWNTDAYSAEYGGFPPGADPLYLSIPFLIGLRQAQAYGLFTDNPHRMTVDLAASDAERYTITAYGGAIDQYLIAGPTMAEVVQRYTRLTGRSSLPPRWALGYHQSRWGYAPDSRVREVAARFRELGIPADAIWLDIQHMDGFRTFTWDAAQFPDPAGLVQDLAAEGFKVVVIADPGIKVDPGWDVYTGGLSADVFLRWPDGELYQGVVWPGDAAFPDFTLPQARAWWAAQVGGVVDRGVGGIWLDVNEPTTFPESGGGNSIPDEVVAFGESIATTMAEVHNVYALSQARATHEGMQARAPSRRPFILSRAGYAGIQRYAAVWTGDAPSRWTNLAETLPMLLNLGLSGVPLVGSDVGGYSGGATPELFARWMALGSISPFFRGHVTSGVNDQEPWAFGIEVTELSRIHISRRYQLLPYLYSLIASATETGEPLLRPLIYEFPDDSRFERLQDQAMLGPFLLVAPVLEQSATERAIQLPEGRWFERYSGALYQGPSNVSLPVTLAALPTYVREGAIIPHGPEMPASDAAPLAPLYLDLYPSGSETRFIYYEDAGDGFGYLHNQAYWRITYTLTGTETGALLLASANPGSYRPPDRSLILRVWRVDGEVQGVLLSGSSIPERPGLEQALALGSGWWRDERDRSLVVVMPDDDDFTLSMSYDIAVADLRPPVSVELEVTVPEGTPHDPPIHVASTANGWNHQPLEWTEDPNVAHGFLSVPRGEWFDYKYTRGSWETVEKWPDCQEAANRYGFGAAHPLRVDTVWGWRDWCD
ncbi:MAG: DUF5110 domain-containing protein [Bradymonadales bacterium]|nr:DUF5110 domain-containing protein [Bradymonadales bacterium]